MTRVTIHAAKTQLSKLIALAESGEEVIIMRDTEPVARLVPVNQPAPRRVFGSLKGQFEVTDAFFEPLPEDELRAWEGDE
jgi:prevent-host-death family protein